MPSWHNSLLPKEIAKFSVRNKEDTSDTFRHSTRESTEGHIYDDVSLLATCSEYLYTGVGFLSECSGRLAMPFRISAGISMPFCV